MIKVIFVNGPPRCGKDSLCDALMEHGVAKTRMSAPLKRTVHESIGHGWVNSQYYDKVKDTPHEDFFGKTPREVYIHMAEKHFKPLYGQDIYGKLWLRRWWKIHENNDAIFSICDVGFPEEIAPIIKAVGGENCAIIQIRRKGCSFANDSRDYVNLNDVADGHKVRGITIENYRDKFDEFAAHAIAWLRHEEILAD